MLDHVEDRIGRIGLRLVVEIEPRVETDIDAAGDDPERDMRRLTAAVAPGNRPRLDGVEGPQAGVEVGDHPAPAAEALGGLVAPLVLRMGMDAVGIRLPDFQQHVLDRRAGAVDDDALDPDALARRVQARQCPSPVRGENLETGGARRKPDMDIGAGRLRGGFFE